MNRIYQVFTALLCVLAVSGAAAQTAEAKARLRSLKPADYPAKTIELGVGFAAGGAMDLVARQLAQKFQDYTGHNMVVQNRPGAGGLVFNRWLLTQASTDGYAIGLGNNMIIGDSLLRADNKWSYHDNGLTTTSTAWPLSVTSRCCGSRRPAGVSKISL